MKKEKKQSSMVLDFENFKWCIENDFQVYLVPLLTTGNGAYKIAVRRGGITTDGLDYKEVNGRKRYSKETLSEKTFKNISDATDYVNCIYKLLRQKYG